VTKKKTATKSAPKKAPILRNKIMLVLDRSGSMAGLCNAAIETTNALIRSIVDNAAKSEQITTVSLMQFGERSYEPVFFEQPASKVRSIGRGDYLPTDHSTALLDATGDAIERLRTLPDANEKDVSLLVLVITDGEENSSQRFTPFQLNELVKKVQSTDRWTLTFQLPRGNKRHFCQSFGVPEGNVAEWDTTEAGMAAASQQTQSSFGTYYAARANGQTCSRGFFTTDLSEVKVTDLKKKLDDISAHVKAWKVERETEIRPFVEAQGVSYVKGSAFYQLTKDEKVQQYKMIAIKEKGKKAIYCGADARKMLGLPEVGEVKVRPGNHANFDIFVQSTSVNRKLVRGTTLLYFIG
jgi:hypothetical protein